MSISYHEREQIGSFFAKLVALGAYFWYASGQGYFNLAENDIKDWGRAVVLLFIFQVVAYTVMMMFVTGIDKSDKPDERDKLIDAKADRIGGYVLASVLFCGFLGLANGISLPAFFVTTVGGMLAFGFISDIARFIMYRRGV